MKRYYATVVHKADVAYDILAEEELVITMTEDVYALKGGVMTKKKFLKKGEKVKVYLRSYIYTNYRKRKVPFFKTEPCIEVIAIKGDMVAILLLEYLFDYTNSSLSKKHDTFLEEVSCIPKTSQDVIKEYRLEYLRYSILTS